CNPGPGSVLVGVVVMITLTKEEREALQIVAGILRSNFITLDHFADTLKGLFERSEEQAENSWPSPAFICVDINAEVPSGWFEIPGSESQAHGMKAITSDPSLIDGLVEYFKARKNEYYGFYAPPCVTFPDTGAAQ